MGYKRGDKVILKEPVLRQFGLIGDRGTVLGKSPLCSYPDLVVERYAVRTSCGQVLDLWVDAFDPVLLDILANI